MEHISECDQINAVHDLRLHLVRLALRLGADNLEERVSADLAPAASSGRLEAVHLLLQMPAIGDHEAFVGVFGNELKTCFRLPGRHEWNFTARLRITVTVLEGEMLGAAGNRAVTPELFEDLHVFSRVLVPFLEIIVASPQANLDVFRPIPSGHDVE